jgi:hypothetical protein
MSVRRVIERDILVRLTETGFVETIRYFGLLDRSLVYEMESVPGDGAACDAKLMLVRMPAKRAANGRAGAPQE